MLIEPARGVPAVGGSHASSWLFLRLDLRNLNQVKRVRRYIGLY